MGGNLRCLSVSIERSERGMVLSGSYVCNRERESRWVLVVVCVFAQLKNKGYGSLYRNKEI
ncbi:hypothetical protein Hanom_Chr14g01266151 [Helianthus anomalus]